MWLRQLLSLCISSFLVGPLQGQVCTNRDFNIVLALAATIEHVENTPSSWHNPGALRVTKEYTHYKSYEQGMMALMCRLWRPGKTLHQILKNYAEAPGYEAIILGRAKLRGDVKLCP